MNKSKSLYLAPEFASFLEVLGLITLRENFSYCHYTSTYSSVYLLEALDMFSTEDFFDLTSNGPPKYGN